jgi:hypothetical protein
LQLRVVLVLIGGGGAGSLLALAPALALPLSLPPHAASRRNAPAARYAAFGFMPPILVTAAATTNPLEGLPQSDLA